MTISYQTESTRSSGALRISIPASVANDLDAFKQSIETLAERLGCASCFSGADCTFEMERDFLVDEKRGVNRGNRKSLTDRPAQTRDITLSVPTEVTNDLKKILTVVDHVARRLGKHGQNQFCCSGFDITFRRELDFMADQDGNVRNIRRE